MVDPSAPVLIVDDNVQYAQLLKRILQSGFGFSSITVVDSPENALNVINQEPSYFRLLFVDYQFPGGLTGGDLLGYLKEKKMLEGKAAFLITADPTMDNLKQAMAAGAKGVVAKPFDRQELKKQLQKAERSMEMKEDDSF